MNYLPSRKQWENWTLPSKATYIGLILTIVLFPAGILVNRFSNNDVEKIVQLLEESQRKQLEMLHLQITFENGQTKFKQKIDEFSPRDRELAAQIPSNADPYALAFKANTEKRFGDARKLLAEAQEKHDVEQSRIYEACGQTETFTRNYNDAISWYQKALALRPDDPSLLNQTATALFSSGKYVEAEPLCQRSLEIQEKAIG